MTRINCSFYGAEGEKLNEHVAMFASEVCTECKGKCLEHRSAGYVIKSDCQRCHGDGYLTNPIKFIPDGMTCASNDYKFGTWLKITKLDKSKTPCIIREPIIVMVTDRGPGAEGRHDWIDLSKGAFEKLAPLEVGILTAEVEVL